jgi:hypothetical protein
VYKTYQKRNAFLSLFSHWTFTSGKRPVGGGEKKQELNGAFVTMEECDFLYQSDSGIIITLLF